jgi:hypothetical protein
MEFSSYMGIYYKDVDGKPRECRTQEDLYAAIASLTTREEVIKVFYLLYYTFDYMKGYNRIIAKNVMRHHSLVFDPQLIEREKEKIASSKRKLRMKKGCVEKLVSIMLNDIRKAYRGRIETQFGLTFTTKRSSNNDKIKAGNTRVSRDSLVLYDWMIGGKFVSIIRIWF